MKRRLMMAPFAVALVAAMAVPAFAAGVGQKAPELEAGGYLNSKGPVSWERLQGKVILIEKWATW